MFHSGSEASFLNCFLEVKTCSKAFLTPYLCHGKIPCFSDITFLQLLGVDEGVSVLSWET